MIDKNEKGLVKMNDYENLIEALRKRDEVLRKNQSSRKYNRYFDIMRSCARNLISQSQQDKLLPLLESESVSIQRDIAGLLFNCYPDICKEVLQKIGNMSVQTGLPKCYINVSISASMALEIGIPKDFP